MKLRSRWLRSSRTRLKACISDRIGAVVSFPFHAGIVVPFSPLVIMVKMRSSERGACHFGLAKPGE